MEKDSGAVPPCLATDFMNFVTVHQYKYKSYGMMVVWIVSLSSVASFSSFLHSLSDGSPIALRKAKIVCSFGLSECNRDQ